MKDEFHVIFAFFMVVLVLIGGLGFLTGHLEAEEARKGCELYGSNGFVTEFRGSFWSSEGYSCLVYLEDGRALPLEDFKSVFVAEAARS